MWNPKRVMLLGVGFVVFLGSYLAYAYFLGGIDGLPPLPEWARHGDSQTSGGGDETRFTRQEEPEVDRKLKMAFGPECPYLNSTIKFEIRKKGLVLASDEMKIEPDGKLRLTPLRLALFSEDKDDGKYPEINTIKSDTALLTFDQPIVNPTEVSNRKIVGAELQGNVTITNNRRTRQTSDDIEVRVDHESLFYDDRLNKIWTAGHVRMLDNQTRPHPTTISGKGLVLTLTKEEPQPKAPKNAKATPKPKGEGGVNGVEHVLLRATVEMHLYPDDSNSGFPGGKERTSKPAQPGGAGPKDGKQEKMHVVIRTEGPFNFDVRRDIAVFESPAPGTSTEEDVHVLREALRPKDDKKDKDGEIDQLLCDRLTLQFRRKKGAPPGSPRDTRSGDREIQGALATTRPGRQVHLVMDTEDLAADCDELIYHCPEGDRGPQTILRGAPMHAVKEGHKIESQELTLTGADAKGNGQRLEARGPGKVDLFDRTVASKYPKNPEKAYPVHALWVDKLVSTKDREGDRILDLLTFTGEAVLVDEEHEQELQGEKIQLWLAPNERPADATTKAQPAQPPQPRDAGAATATQQRLHKIKGFERVRARSPEMKIHKCSILTICFEDGVQTLPAVASAGPAEKTAPAGDAPLPVPGGANAPPATGSPTALPAPAGQDAARPAPAGEADKDKDKEKKKPIELWARNVTAYVTRVGPKNDLRELVSEGNVHVHQDGSKPDDKGVDIKGEMLELQHHLAGDILTVYGDAHNRAQLQLGDLYLEGPKVKIDQQKNLAWVEGLGAMTMPSGKTLDGSKATKPGTLLTVHWTKDMVFNGKDADFQGGVVAYQDNASLKCQTLQVTLDKTVSFKEGQKGGQSAKVEKMISHGKCYVVDSKRDEVTGALVQYQRLLAHQIAAGSEEDPTIAEGPGTVYILRKGGDDPLSAKPGPPDTKAGAAPPPAKGKEEMKLTRVDFEDRMFSLEKNKTRMSKFYKNVKVLHLSADNPDVKVDVDNPPKGAMYMTCDILTVNTLPLAGGKSTQEMRGERQVFFRTQEFFGRADVVKYNESRDQVIFEGKPATLYRRKVGARGIEYDTITGRTILYNRREGTFVLDRGEVINLNQ